VATTFHVFITPAAKLRAVASNIEWIAELKIGTAIAAIETVCATASKDSTQREM
jgi:hypothetical protein